MNFSIQDAKLSYDAMSHISTVETKLNENSAEELAEAFANFRDARHDFIVSLISKVLGFTDMSKKKIYEVLNLPLSENTNKSPDLYKLENKGPLRLLKLIEVGVSESPNLYRQDKLIKYIPLIEELRDHGYDVDYKVCVLHADGNDVSDLVNISDKFLAFTSLVTKNIRTYTYHMRGLTTKAAMKGLTSEFNVLIDAYGSGVLNWEDNMYSQTWLDLMDKEFRCYIESEPCKPVEIDWDNIKHQLDILEESDVNYRDSEKKTNSEQITLGVTHLRNTMCEEYKEDNRPITDKSFILPDLSLINSDYNYTMYPEIDKESCQCLSLLDDLISMKQYLSLECRLLTDCKEAYNKLKQGSAPLYNDIKQQFLESETKQISEYYYKLHSLRGEERLVYKNSMKNEISKLNNVIKDIMKQKLGEQNYYFMSNRHFRIPRIDEKDLKSMGYKAKKNKLNSEEFTEQEVYSPNENTDDIKSFMKEWCKETNEFIWDDNYNNYDRDVRTVYNAALNISGLVEKKKPRFMKHAEVMSKLFTSIKYSMSYNQSNNRIVMGTAGFKDILYIVGPGRSGVTSNMSKPYKIFIRSKTELTRLKESSLSIEFYNGHYYYETNWLRHPTTVLDSWSTCRYTLFPVCISIMFDTVKDKVNYELASIASMIMFSNKKHTSVFLSDYRYLYMAATSYSCNFYDLITDKFKILLRTKLDVYLWNRIISRIGLLYKSAYEGLVVERGRVVENNDQLSYKLPSIFTDYYYDSWSASLNEMYLSHLIEKDNRNPMHDQIKGCENALEYLIKYHNLKRDYPNMFDGGVVETDSKKNLVSCMDVLNNEFGFNNLFVRASADALLEEIGMNDLMVNNIMNDKCMRKNISSLSNMNNSISETNGRIKSIESVIAYCDKEEYTMQKLSSITKSFITGKIESREYALFLVKEDMSILREACKILKKPNMKLVFGISRKVQVGDFREIYVMNFETRICQKLIESFMESLSKRIPEEYISVNSDKRPVQLERDMNEFYTECYDQGLKVINEVADCTKWAPSSTVEEFICWIDQASKYLPAGICSYIKYFFKMMLHKKLQLPQKFVESAKKFKFTKYHNFLKENEKDNFIDYPVSFMMGIFNYFSSVKHCAKSSLARKLSDDYRNGFVKYKSYQHSDDSFKMIGYKEEKYLHKFVHRERIIAKLVNIKYSKKKTNFSFYFAEFLSIFYYNCSLFVPYIKFVKSIKDNMEHKSYHSDYFYVVSKACEAFRKGASIFTSQEIMRSGLDMIDDMYGLDSNDLNRIKVPPEMLGRPFPSIVMLSFFGNICVYDTLDQYYKNLLCDSYRPDREAEEKEDYSVNRTLVGAPDYIYVKRVKPSKVAVDCKTHYNNGLFKDPAPDFTSKYNGKSNMFLDMWYLVNKCFDKKVMMSMSSSSYHNAFLNTAYFVSNRCIQSVEDEKKLLTLPEFSEWVHNKYTEYKQKKLVDECYIDLVSKLYGENYNAAKIMAKSLSIGHKSDLSKKKFRIKQLNMTSRIDMNLQLCERSILYKQNPMMLTAIFPGIREDKLEATYSLIMSQFKASGLNVPINQFVSAAYSRKPVYCLVPKINEGRCTPLILSVYKYSTMVNGVMRVNAQVENSGLNVEVSEYKVTAENYIYGALINHLKLVCMIEKKELNSVVNRTYYQNRTVYELLDRAMPVQDQLPPNISADIEILQSYRGKSIDRNILSKGCGVYIHCIKEQKYDGAAWQGKGEFLLCYMDRILGVIDADDNTFTVSLANLPSFKLFKELISVCKRYFKLSSNHELEKLYKVPREETEIVSLLTVSQGGVYKVDFRFKLFNGVFYKIDDNKVMKYRKSYDNRSFSHFTPISKIDEFGSVFDSRNNRVYKFGKYNNFKIIGENFVTYLEEDMGENYIDSIMIEKYLSDEPIEYFETHFGHMAESEAEEDYNYIVKRTGWDIKRCLTSIKNKREIVLEIEKVSFAETENKIIEIDDEDKYSEDSNYEDIDIDDDLPLEGTDFMVENPDNDADMMDDDEEDLSLYEDFLIRGSEEGVRYQFVTYKKSLRDSIQNIVERFKDKRLDIIMNAYKGTSKVVKLRLRPSTIKVVNDSIKLMVNNPNMPGIKYKKLMILLCLIHYTPNNSVTYSGSVNESEAIKRIKRSVYYEETWVDEADLINAGELDNL